MLSVAYCYNNKSYTLLIAFMVNVISCIIWSDIVGPIQYFTKQSNKFSQSDHIKRLPNILIVISLWAEQVKKAN